MIRLLALGFFLSNVFSGLAEAGDTPYLQSDKLDLPSPAVVDCVFENPADDG